MPADIRTSQAPSFAASVKRGDSQPIPPHQKQPHRRVHECLSGWRGRQEQADRHTCLIPFFLFILERTVGAGFPFFPPRLRRKRRVLGKLEDGGRVSGPVASTTALVLTSPSAFQRLRKETGSNHYRMEFGNKAELAHCRAERRAEPGRGRTLS